AEVALDLVAALLWSRVVVLARLQRFPDHSFLQQLTTGRLEVVGEHENRLCGRMHLRALVRREALRPASKLFDLAVIHGLPYSPPGPASASPNSEDGSDRE